MGCEAVGTDEFVEWYVGLDEQAQEAVTRGVDLLELCGVTLGFPHSSDINGTRYPLRELRVQAGGRPLRVLYAFDPRRNAVLLIGGDKTGDERFYETMITKAERIWTEYLAEQAAGEHDEES